MVKPARMMTHFHPDFQLRSTLDIGDSGPDTVYMYSIYVRLGKMPTANRPGCGP